MYNPIDSSSMEQPERTASVKRMGAKPTETTAFPSRPVPFEVRPAAPPAKPPFRFDLERCLRWLFAGRWWIVALAILGALGGFAFVQTVKPLYTVSTEVLVDPSNLKVISDDLFTESQQRDTQLLDAESKLRILTSGNVLARVVSDLNLEHDPEFVGDPSAFSFRGMIKKLIGTEDTSLKDDPSLVALRTLEKRIDAGREERSFIVTVKVWTEEAAKSVLIANKLVAAFQDELVKAESDDAGRTAAALFDRLDGLKASVAAADQAVEAFKREHDLQSSSGELVSTLLANQINARVVDARARVILAESRYKELTEAGANGLLNANALQSDTMTQLRARYAAIKQQVDSQSAVLASGHPTLIALKAQMRALEGQIADETARMVQAAKTELDEAHASLASLEAEADKMKTTVFADKDAQVQLRELERDAESKAAVYGTFLTRARQVTERQQLNTTNVRVISPALPPASRSWPPRTAMVMGAGAFAGLMLGAFLSIGLGLLGALRRAKRA